jgi:hypothetical protein
MIVVALIWKNLVQYTIPDEISNFELLNDFAKVVELVHRLDNEEFLY